MSKHGDGDKRKVSTDALETLGNIIGPNEKRDAIHLAVEPITAGEWLDPGEDVMVKGGEAFGCGREQGVGIVDPFLTDTVQRGQRFWLVIYPRQINSLRHVWTHPAFPDEPAVLPPVSEYDVSQMLTVQPPGPTAAESEQWLIDWCRSNDCPSWESVKSAILEVEVPINDDATQTELQLISKDSEYWVFLGTTAHCDVPDEFWEHAENALGIQIPDKVSSFSCSC